MCSAGPLLSVTGLEAKVSAEAGNNRNGEPDRQILHGVNLTVNPGEVSGASCMLRSVCLSPAGH